jgi:hypothetical protein
MTKFSRNLERFGAALASPCRSGKILNCAPIVRANERSSATAFARASPANLTKRSVVFIVDGRLAPGTTKPTPAQSRP